MLTAQQSQIENNNSQFISQQPAAYSVPYQFGTYSPPPSAPVYATVVDDLNNNNAVDYNMSTTIVHATVVNDNGKQM